MSSRRSRLAVIVLLLTSAIFASSSYFNIPQPVQAAPSLTLSPTYAGRGSVVSVSGSGFSFGNGTTLTSTSAACAFYSLDAKGNTGTLVSSPICSVSGTTISGSFVVTGALSPIYNPYTVIVNATDATHYLKAQATFTVTAISITPSIGSRGQVIYVNGSVGGNDATCSISGTIVGTSSCVISGSIGGNFSGSFVVSNVATPGPYKIRVTGSPSGVFVEATFTVQGPSITLNPNSGRVGDFVGVDGTGFSFSDTTCSIKSPSLSSVVLSPACSINAATGKPKGNFTVGNVSPGSYVIRVTGSTGDFAEATFFVTIALGSLVLSPTNATNGATVTFIATGFSATDTGCVVQSTGNGVPNTLLITSPTCTISSRVATGSFIVGPLATTNVKWNVTVKGTPANDVPIGEWAIFNVTASISVTPTTGNNGTVVSFSGSGFSSLAASCVLSLVPASSFYSITCGIAGTSGQVSGSFVVSAGPGVYLVQVTDNTGKIAGTTFTVGSPSATITLVPNAVPPGGNVSVIGSGFNSGDSSCTITPTTIMKVAPGVCTVSGGIVAGAFNISTTAIPGYYIITITASPNGDFANNILFVTPSGPTTTTTTSTSISIVTTSYTTVTSTTPVTLTTTTFTFTGVSTETEYTRTTTTIFGLSTASLVTTTITTQVATSQTTALTTTTSTHTFTLGGIVSPMLGLLSVIAMLGWILLRRSTV